MASEYLVEGVWYTCHQTWDGKTLKTYIGNKEINNTKMTYINKNSIISASIIEPFKNSGNTWDLRTEHGWQVCFLMGYVGHEPNTIIVNKNTKEECIELIESLGLIPI